MTSLFQHNALCPEVCSCKAGPSPKKPSTSLRVKHEEFYFEDGNITFLVDNVLFKIHRSTLARNSPVFDTMFQLPSGSGAPENTDGTDENPAQFPSVTAAEFTNLLRMLHPKLRPRIFETNDLIQVVKLATKWEFDEIRTYTIEELKERNLNNIERLILAQECQIDAPDWKLKAILSLARSRCPLSKYNAERLGVTTTRVILQSRDRILRERIMRLSSTPSKGRVSCGRYDCERDLIQRITQVLCTETQGDLVEGNGLSELANAMRDLDGYLCETCSVDGRLERIIGTWLNFEGDMDLVRAIVAEA